MLPRRDIPLRGDSSIVPLKQTYARYWPCPRNLALRRSAPPFHRFLPADLRLRPTYGRRPLLRAQCFESAGPPALPEARYNQAHHDSWRRHPAPRRRRHHAPGLHDLRRRRSNLGGASARAPRRHRKPRRLAAWRIQPLLPRSRFAPARARHAGLLGDLLDAIASAAICAMSISLGGVFETPASASRNMVLQKGQAAPTTVAPVATNSSARSTLTRLPFSSPRNARPPPAPQQNDRSRERGGSITSPNLPITDRGSS